MARDIRAAIDIGTVTTRLLIAEVAPDGAITEVLRDRAITDLGSGVDETGHLAPEAIERVGVAIDRFMAEIREAENEAGAAIPLMAVATSASRDARNADEFTARLARSGLELDIIPGEREAALSFAGASSAFPGERVVVVDAGGGSTEIIAGLAGQDPDRARSFNVGCRRVTERFFHSDPPTPDELLSAFDWMNDEFAPWLGELSDEGLLDARMVAVAGTATSIISMRERMVVYDQTRVHGAVAMRSDVDALLENLASMTVDQRRNVVGLDPGRAPVIVGGMLIVRQVMDLIGVPEFTVSERDILHGIIMAQR